MLDVMTREHVLNIIKATDIAINRLEHEKSVSGNSSGADEPLAYGEDCERLRKARDLVYEVHSAINK